MTDPVHVTWHDHTVDRQEREQLNRHRGCVIWFTGLSGSGKSTVANLVDHKLHAQGVHSYVLDGDNVRQGLNAAPGLLTPHYGEPFAQRFGLGFSEEDRRENIRRIGAVSQLFCAAGIVTLTAFVSPYRRDRDEARQLVAAAGKPEDFIEIFVDTPLEICESRDPKGLYRMAREGKLKGFTGIDAPYEPPIDAELRIAGGDRPAEELAEQVVSYLKERGVLSLGEEKQGK